MPILFRNFSLFKMSQPLPLISLFSIFEQQFYRKIVDFNGIRTQIVREEGKHDDDHHHGPRKISLYLPFVDQTNFAILVPSCGLIAICKILIFMNFYINQFSTRNQGNKVVLNMYQYIPRFVLILCTNTYLGLYLFYVPIDTLVCIYIM